MWLLTSRFISRQGRSDPSDEQLRAKMKIAATLSHPGGGDDRDLGRKPKISSRTRQRLVWSDTVILKKTLPPQAWEHQNRDPQDDQQSNHKKTKHRSPGGTQAIRTDRHEQNFRCPGILFKDGQPHPSWNCSRASGDSARPWELWTPGSNNPNNDVRSRCLGLPC